MVMNQNIKMSKRILFKYTHAQYACDNCLSWFDVYLNDLYDVFNDNSASAYKIIVRNCPFCDNVMVNKQRVH